MKDNRNPDGSVYRHAISYEWDSGEKKYYFELSVTDSVLNADSYCMGSGLNNGNPDLSSSTITVNNSQFNTAGRTPSYEMHVPNPAKELIVENTTFGQVKSAAIKYVYNQDNEDHVMIMNNDFSQCNSKMQSPGYALLCTNLITDNSDKHSGDFATHFSGNNICGQNVLILAKANQEVIWVPDDKAVNAPSEDKNTADSGTRYAMSSATVNDCMLTDFNLADSQMNFTVGDATKDSSYFYNTKDGAGAYSDCVKGFGDYFTDENPRHCGASITTWGEANDITRWKLDDTALTKQEDSAVYTGENATARVVVDTKKGTITVTPKAIGSTKLTATVGAGEDGKLPNSKSSSMDITVSAKPQFTVTVNYLDAKTKQPIADPSVSKAADVGSAYDVNELQKAEIGEYTFKSADGDALTGTLDGNKVVNLYYEKEEVIDDNNTPHDKPTETPDTKPTEIPVTKPVEKIEDNKTPLAAPKSPKTGATGALPAFAIMCVSGIAAIVIKKKSK